MIFTGCYSRISHFSCLILHRSQTVRSMNFSVNIVAFTKNLTMKPGTRVLMRYSMVWWRMVMTSGATNLQFLAVPQIPNLKNLRKSPARKKLNRSKLTSKNSKISWNYRDNQHQLRGKEATPSWHLTPVTKSLPKNSISNMTLVMGWRKSSIDFDDVCKKVERSSERILAKEIEAKSQY